MGFYFYCISSYVPLALNNVKKVVHTPQVEHKTGFLPAIVWTSAALFYLYEYIVRVAPNVMFSELETAFELIAQSFHFHCLLSLHLRSYATDRRNSCLIVLVVNDLLSSSYTHCCSGCIIPTLSTNSLWTLTLVVLLMGFGSAFGFVGVLYVATVWYPPQRIAFLSGLTTALGMLGAMMGATSFSTC